MQDFYKILRDIYISKEKPPILEKHYNEMKEVQFALEMRMPISDDNALKDFINFIEFYRKVEIEHIIKFGFENGMKVGMDLSLNPNLIPNLERPKLLQEIVPLFWRYYRETKNNEPFNEDTLFYPPENEEPKKIKKEMPDINEDLIKTKKPNNKKLDK